MLIWVFSFVSSSNFSPPFGRSHQELERIISLSGTPTMIWNTSGQILKVGDEFCMLTEWSREDLVGKHIETVSKSLRFHYAAVPQGLHQPLELTLLKNKNCYTLYTGV
jgi:hypothetical protein